MTLESSEGPTIFPSLEEKDNLRILHKIIIILPPCPTDLFYACLSWVSNNNLFP